MSTPNPTLFTPLTKGFSWQASTTGEGGASLPAGEVQTGSTIGVRADGDAAFSPGNYKWFVPVSGTASTEPLADFQAKAKLPPGNYWAAVDQTDMLGTDSATSGWTGEVPFSIPAPIVKPAPPTAFIAA